LLALLLGCRSDPSYHPTRAGLIGEYVYYSADSGSPHAADTLILKEDGTYTLVYQKPPLGSVRGTWRYVSNTVILDSSAGYEAEAHRDDVRLIINIDLGHYYKKVK
jgi:hypothetical protein